MALPAMNAACFHGNWHGYSHARRVAAGAAALCDLAEIAGIQHPNVPHNAPSNAVVLSVLLCEGCRYVPVVALLYSCVILDVVYCSCFNPTYGVFLYLIFLSFSLFSACSLLLYECISRVS